MTAVSPHIKVACTALACFAKGLVQVMRDEKPLGLFCLDCGHKKIRALHVVDLIEAARNTVLRVP